MNETLNLLVSALCDYRWILSVVLLVATFKLDLKHPGRMFAEVANNTIGVIQKIWGCCCYLYNKIMYRKLYNMVNNFNLVGYDGYGHNALVQFIKGCICWLSSNDCDELVKDYKQLDDRINDFTTTYDNNGYDLMERVGRIFIGVDAIEADISHINRQLQSIKSPRNECDWSAFKNELLPILSRLNRTINEQAIELYRRGLISKPQYSELNRRFTDGDL